MATLARNLFKKAVRTPLGARGVATTGDALNLGALGITNNAHIDRNLTYDEIHEHVKANNEGTITNNGTFAVDTGKFTGRSPGDKWIVQQGESADNFWWGKVNQPITPEIFDELYAKSTAHFNSLDKFYVFDGFCGANPASRKKVRFLTKLAWQHHFVTNMFIRPSLDEIEDFEPDYTIINSCGIENEDWERHGLNSEVFVAFNTEKSVAVIGGTWYGGEMKKGIFSMMNYWLPLEGIMPMHCSANCANDGSNSALFFGLSGTGKTTLSADPNRLLIGDDEHGWDNDGIFNFEGGCYAKTIDLTEENEPEIYRAIKQNAMLENVWIEDGEPDYFNTSKTQNGRVSYPIEHIPNYKTDSMAGHPDAIIFLTCDAYGVLPPVSKLTPGQAMYHFLSGYTAKVAGTERGIDEPEATFSACFGAAFLTLHPTKYADLLQKKLEDHPNARCYLVNTGWTGGAYGTGERMSIKNTRKCIDAILDGSVEDAEFTTDAHFGLSIPSAINGVDTEVLNPRSAWADADAYDAAATKLAGMFKENFVQYTGPGVTDYTSHGPL